MNKLAFSTLGTPAWDIDRILSAALEYGYNAVELRGYLDTMDMPNAEPFAPANRHATLARFADAGVSFCCASSGAVVVKNDADEVRRYAELAHDLNCPFVRVFGGTLGAVTMEEAVTNLHGFGEIAANAGVRIVLETHDSFSTGESVARLIALTNHPAVRSLWDLHHPYRQNEPFAETFGFLSASLSHVHIKNSTPEGKYCLPEEGDVPLIAMLQHLRGAGYGGAICLEWEKRWHPEVVEPEIALPAYANAVRNVLSNV
ncbi:MAG: sugar phosphate isomerase/epimerase [Armatimonadetes bacterium]|nr:sugar phosphate isomerase/epimerase [Armatimonadota bacterium]